MINNDDNDSTVFTPEQIAFVSEFRKRVGDVHNKTNEQVVKVLEDMRYDFEHNQSTKADGTVVRCWRLKADHFDWDGKIGTITFSKLRNKVFTKVSFFDVNETHEFSVMNPETGRVIDFRFYSTINVKCPALLFVSETGEFSIQIET